MLTKNNNFLNSTYDMTYSFWNWGIMISIGLILQIIKATKPSNLIHTELDKLERPFWEYPPQ